MSHRIPLGPFELHRRIGRGGMGEVWEGLHVPQQIPIAVKVLTHRGVKDDVFLEAFRTEVRELAGLNHPGIVTVLDYGEILAGAAKLSEGAFEAGSPYLVMELARRGSLKRFIDAIGWFEVKVVLFTILDALAHAHAAGVIHRDLKPENILVGCGSEHTPGIKLTDFGLAHAIDQHEFPSATALGWGTPQFMAPEQFRGAWRDYGPWTDLYALGVMAYFLCVGSYPYVADDTAGWSRAHQIGEAPDFQSRFPVPEGFAQWIGRLMEPQLQDRFQYAADAAWALQKLGDPEHVSRKRDTVSMIPISGERDRWVTEGRLQMPHVTVEWRDPAAQRGDTIVDRPSTTRLIDPEMASVVAVAATLRFAADEPLDSSRGTEREKQGGGYREAPPLPYTWLAARSYEPSPKLVGAGLGLFGIRTLPLVDREEERDALWSALSEVRDDHVAQAVVIRGAAGTGKSRLARWLCERAHEVGSASVLKAVFSPIAGPGDGLSRMVAQQLRAGGMDVRQTMRRIEEQMQRHGVRDTQEVVALTRFVLPLESTSPEILSLAARMHGPNARYALLARHLQRLSEDRPVVVWFDDVQWGADALAFTQYMIERQHHTPVPVLFLLTTRNEALVQRSGETELVSELVRNRRSFVIDVEALTAADTSALVRELLFLSPTLATEVERRCGGNPLFAVQLVGDWVAGGKLQFGSEGFELKRGVAAIVPDDLHEMWRERLDLLLRRRSQGDRIALEIAAALGASVEVDEWAATCAEYGVSASPGLTRDLLESGLVVQSDYGFEFCHGLFRESIERLCEDAGRSAQVHEACVRMLAKSYPAQQFPFAERQAQHIIAAGDGERAIGPLWAAARARIDRSEFELALSLLDQRDQLLDEHGFDPNAVEWSVGWSTRAKLHLWLGHYAEVEAYASRAAVEARRNGWPEILARATLTEGLGYLHQGDLDAAERSFERAMVEFDRLRDDGGCGQCLHGLGRVAHGRRRFDAAFAHYHNACDRLVQVGHWLGHAQCLNALGDLERDLENWDAALGYARQAQELFEQVENAIGVADCINDIAELHRLRGDHDEARKLCTDALRRYEALGSEHSMHVRINLALTLDATGARPQARQLLDEVRARFEQSEQEAQLATVHLLLVPILIGLDEVELAIRRFQMARPVVRRYELRDRDAAASLYAAAAEMRKRGEAEHGAQMDTLAVELSGSADGS